jgi:hypothetical protein
MQIILVTKEILVRSRKKKSEECFVNNDFASIPSLNITKNVFVIFVRTGPESVDLSLKASWTSADLLYSE